MWELVLGPQLAQAWHLPAPFAGWRQDISARIAGGEPGDREQHTGEHVEHGVPPGRVWRLGRGQWWCPRPRGQVRPRQQMEDLFSQ